MNTLVTLGALMLTLYSFSVNGADPTIDPDYTTLFVQQYRELSLTCQSTGSGSLHWYRGNQDVSSFGFSTSRTGTDTLTIKKVSTQKSDSGEYRCQSDSGQRRIQVNVFSENVTNANFDKNKESVRLGCSLIDVDLSFMYTMHWEFKGRQLQNGTKYQIIPKTLVINSPTPMDAGEYFCVYNISENMQVFKIPVNFYASPSVKKPEQTKLFGLEQPIILKCEVYTYPPVSITWYRNNTMVKDMENIQVMTDDNSTNTNDLLKISSASFDDQGNYSCTAHSGFYDKSAHITFLVTVGSQAITVRSDVYLLSLLVVLLISLM